jgi:hypothetical protein
VQPGDIYLHPDFYCDLTTGTLEAKYFVVLAFCPSGDVVARLLTSRAHGRPEQPPCFHGNPYPSFFLGVLGGKLGSKSWLDLRGLDDFDRDQLERRIQKKRVSFVMALSNDLLAQLLECFAAAEDTSRLQEKAARDLLARIRSA